MRTAARFLLILLMAAILALVAAAGLFVGISAANELRMQSGNAAVFGVLFVPCFFLLSYILVRQRERVEN